MEQRCKFGGTSGGRRKGGLALLAERWARGCSTKDGQQKVGIISLRQKSHTAMKEKHRIMKIAYSAAVASGLDKWPSS